MSMLRTLSDHVGLHIPVVVLACPDEASVRLESLGNHVINEPVLVPDALVVVCLLVFTAMYREGHNRT